MKLDDGKSWLAAAPKNKSWGVGCRACSRDGAKTAWGRFEVRSKDALQMCNFLRHEATIGHQVAVGSLSRNRKACAPSKDAFKAVLLGRWERKSLRVLAPRVGSRFKVQHLQFCLAEAARQELRKALRKAVSITLHQDGRGARLLTRVRACDSQLRITRGTVVAAKSGKHQSRDLVAATRESIRTLCTPNHGAPGLNLSSALPDH